MALCEFVDENFNTAIEYRKNIYEIDQTWITNLALLGEYCMMNGDYLNSLKYIKEWLDRSNSLSEGGLYGLHRVGWAYWMNGFEEEGARYFSTQIANCKQLIESGRTLKYTYRKYYDLAATYAFMGEKEKAYESLRNFNKSQMFDKWWCLYVRYDPLLDPIRDEPEFQQIARDVEAKYQAEHERVRQWLEENDML
jgi:tetratricopeptide (TPR) repeat protein